MSLPNTVKRKGLLNHDMLAFKTSGAWGDCLFCCSFSLFLFVIKVKILILGLLIHLSFSWENLFLLRITLTAKSSLVIFVQAQLCCQLYLGGRTVSFTSLTADKNNCYPYVWLQYIQENRRSVHNNDKVLKENHKLKVEISLLYMQW